MSLMAFQLSPDQTNAVQGICDILLDPTLDKCAFAVLTGDAGTGKTTVISEILEQTYKQSTITNIELCAATHRAAAVMQDIVGREVTTGHAAFKLRPTVNKYGKEVLKSAGICRIPFGSLVIIDEAPMIGDQFLKAIVDIVQKRSLKVLFVGDPYQLPPTNDKCSIFDGSLPTFTLTTHHRQLGDNPILDKAAEFRDFIKGVRTDMPVVETSINANGEGIQVLPHADFVTQFVKKYLSYATGAEVDVPLCTYTNESAINYNGMIRKAAYFLEDRIEPFYPGERLIANSIVKTGDRTLLTNNESVTVISFTEGDHCGIPGFSVKVQGNYDKNTGSDIKTVFSPVNKVAADRILNEYKAVALRKRDKSGWLDFYELKNFLADLRPPFAGTTHKIQGGTFFAVFIDQKNIAKCRDPIVRARLMYVALTRASGSAFVNG